MSIFQQAAQQKLRFPCRGMITTEDLYDLSLEDLDTLYQAIETQVKEAQKPSLLATKSTRTEKLELQRDIVKSVFETKQAAVAAARDARENRAKRQRLLAILENKQETELQGKSVEEIQAMIDAL